MTPARPVFSDGAILGAADLTALAQLDRDRAARAVRHLHTPGVGAGLKLTAAPPADPGDGPPYVEVQLTPGYAIDGTGRELVLSGTLPVSAERFTSDDPNAASGWYPVFVHGLDAPQAASNGVSGCQGSAGPTRISEDVDFVFGRLGDAGAEQRAPAPDAGPGGGTWNVLVGFVDFDADINKFVSVRDVDDSGVRVAAAGVRAGLVAGQAGRVELRPDAAVSAGLPAVVVDAGDGSLVFGLHNGTGAVKPLMKVDSTGNLEVLGTVSAAQTAGTVRVLSGTAFDGAVLPLPRGVTQAEIDSGKYEVATLLTPRYPSTTNGMRFLPAECRVDEDRVLHCWGSVITIPGATAAAQIAAACDYLVVVTVVEADA